MTGDNVTALAMCDVNGDSRPELLVGSDDFDLRVFQDEAIVAETSEADQFVGLCSITVSVRVAARLSVFQSVDFAP